MVIHVDFDLILIAIFITIFITGYIRGGGIELLRVLKVIIPFFVLYFYGDKLTDYLFSSRKIVNFVQDILPNVPYRNTLAALSSKLFLYIIIYTFLTLFLWRLGKYVLDERIEYLFGKLNSILGGIFSIVRMYIIISIIIIPFYALNFTNYSDPLTSFVLNHPPHFSRIGLLIDKSKPTVDKINEVTASLKIMDIKSLQKYTNLLTDVKDFIDTNEYEAYKIYHYQIEHNEIDREFTKSEYLAYYIENLEEFKKKRFSDESIDETNETLLDIVNEYKAVFNWAYNNKIKDMETEEEVINSFIENYPEIVSDTEDELTIEMLTKMKVNTQLYLILKNWFYESYQIDINSGYSLLDDVNIEKVLNEFDLYKDNLIKAINNNLDVKNSEKAPIIKQIDRFANFQQDYISIYKPKIAVYDKLLNNVSFKYKLTFAIMKENNFEKIVNYEIEKDSIMYLFFMDSLDFINFFNQDEDIYFEVAQVYISLFLVDINENLEVEPMNYDLLIEHLYKLSKNEDLFNQTKMDINKIIKTILIKNNDGIYLEYLINNGFCERDLINKLLNTPNIKTILTSENYILLESIEENLD